MLVDRGMLVGTAVGVGVTVVGFSVAVTGHTVVYKSIVSVTTTPRAGQFVTVAAQDVTV